MPEEVETPYIPPESQEDIFYRSDLMRATEKIIEDDFVKKKLENFPLWSIVSKTYKLTFFEIRDVYSQENLFEAEVNKLLRSIPPCMHSSELYLKIGQARMIFHANLRRALGTNNRGKMNERIALLSQVRQLITTSTQKSGGGIRGFFRGLVRR